MPGVESNTPHRCLHCGTVIDIGRIPGGYPCPNCGQVNWTQIRVVTVCDFCSSTANARWTYPARDFPMSVDTTALDTTAYMSRGDWLACDDCHALIQAGDLACLATRCVDYELPRTRSRQRGELFREIRDLHDRFMANRTGDPYVKEDDNGT